MNTMNTTNNPMVNMAGIQGIMNMRQQQNMKEVMKRKAALMQETLWEVWEGERNKK